jgi:hypothetical protein
MHENAFTGKSRKPSDADLTAALGPAREHWDQLIDAAKKMGVGDQEWRSYSPKYGWALRLKQKKRNILYLSPGSGCFLASLILGDRAMDAARHCGLAKSALKVLDEATKYPEGTAIRIEIRKQKDTVAIKKLMTVKIAS